MAATTISRSNIGTNDDGSGTTGTVINTAYVGLLYDNIDALFSSTTGVTFNQGAGDVAILTLESSDVAHGITDYATTSCYGAFMKQTANDGGLQIRALTEVTQAFEVFAFNVTDDTTKTTSSVGNLTLYAAKKSGTGIAAIGANANALVVRNFGTTRHILDGDGDSHQDVGTAWTNFDAFDDVALLNAFTGVVSRQGDPLRQAFAGLVSAHRDALTAHRIVTINDHDGGDGSIFVNWSRFQMLMLGAVRQLARLQDDTTRRMLALEGAR